MYVCVCVSVFHGTHIGRLEVVYTCILLFLTFILHNIIYNIKVGAIDKVIGSKYKLFWEPSHGYLTSVFSDKTRILNTCMSHDRYLQFTWIKHVPLDHHSTFIVLLALTIFYITCLKTCLKVWMAIVAYCQHILFVLAEEEYTHIQTVFKRDRRTLPAMFLSTPSDQLQSIWTRKCPTLDVVQQLVMLSTQALQVLTSLIGPSQKKCDIKVCL